MTTQDIGAGMPMISTGTSGMYPRGVMVFPPMEMILYGEAALISRPSSLTFLLLIMLVTDPVSMVRGTSCSLTKTVALGMDRVELGRARGDATSEGWTLLTNTGLTSA